MRRDSLDRVITTMLDEDPNGWSWNSHGPSFRILEHTSGVSIVLGLMTDEWSVPFGRWKPPYHKQEYPFDYIKIGRRLSWRLNGMRKEAKRQEARPKTDGAT